MADRKQTPDVLAEILGESSPPEAPQPVLTLRPLPGAPRPQPAAAARTAARRQVTAPKAGRWEHMVVSFQNYHGWRPRFVNGVQIAAWDQGPLIHDYLQQRGAEGWEVAGASGGSSMYGTADYQQVYFKRRIS